MKKHQRALLDALSAHTGHSVTIDAEDGTNFADGERWYRVEVYCATCSRSVVEVTEWEGDRE